ncbi:hypothetical protein GCM10010412_066720 [Nonomuraea recticatena]|uniref:Lipoprotein n=1 Tax=Nonomuraea recticatena TaxID=46178 RepID=A0ABN3SQ37_9ACTN
MAVPRWVVTLSTLVALTGCSGPSDADTVYCFASQRQAEMISAIRVFEPSVASAQGILLEDGTPVSLQTWRAKHPATFDRACAALNANAARSGPSLLAMALSGLAGAAIALLASWLWRRQSFHREHP